MALQPECTRKPTAAFFMKTSAVEGKRRNLRMHARKSGVKKRTLKPKVAAKHACVWPSAGAVLPAACCGVRSSTTRTKTE